MGLIIYFLSCSTNKYVISDNDIRDNRVIILGVVEYDFTQMENKNIKGLDIFLDSNDKILNFKLPNNFLQNDRIIKQYFISSIVNFGNFRLCYRRNVSSSESDNLLTLMNAYRNNNTSEKIALQEYSINAGKIVNIGKLIVKYQGGKVNSGNINYSFSFQFNNNDTLALHAFKKTYSSIYKKFSDELYMFNK